MIDKSTEELDTILKGMKPEEIETFKKSNLSEMMDSEKAFYYYVKDVLAAKGILMEEVYLTMDVTEKYGGSLIRQEKHTKNRDMIIRMCVGGHFSCEETNRALKLYGMKPLYARDGRDACLMVAINNRIYDVGRLDEILEREGYGRLSRTE